MITGAHFIVYSKNPEVVRLRRSAGVAWPRLLSPEAERLASTSPSIQLRLGA